MKYSRTDIEKEIRKTLDSIHKVNPKIDTLERLERTSLEEIQLRMHLYYLDRKNRYLSRLYNALDNITKRDN